MVISTLQQSPVTEAATVQGYALTGGVERKVAAHSDACHAAGVSFLPLLQSLGGWCEEAVDCIAIGHFQNQCLGIPLVELMDTP